MMRLPPEFALSSTHAFGIVDAVCLARTLGLLPRRLFVYAGVSIEQQSIEHDYLSIERKKALRLRSG
jgi:hypothetical protein